MAEEISSQPGGADTKREPPGPSQNTDRTKPNFEPTQDERDVVGRWLRRIDSAKKRPAMKDWYDQLEMLRGYVAGTKHNDQDKKKLVRTNMVYATIAAQMPELYAKNPTIQCTPDEGTPSAKQKLVREFCDTADIVVKKLFVDEGRLKKRAKANIRSTSSTSYGCLKLSFQHEYRGDPIIIKRVEDTQDNLSRLEARILDAKREDDTANLANIRDEIKANLDVLRSRKEISVYKGFAVDRVISEDLLILDENVVEFDEYSEADAIGQQIWMRVSDARDLFQMDMKGATRYLAPRADNDKYTGPEKPKDEEQFVCVVEIWDKGNGVVRTTALGMNRWLREPYVPQNVSRRWYPFYILAFNVIEGRWRPISDVELLMGLQDEYNDVRTNYADHRQKACPILIVRKAGGLSEEDVEKLTNRKNKDTIAIEGTPTVPISEDAVWFEGAKVDPNNYDVTIIRNDMDLVTGRSDASRANLIKPKTATEAEIMAEAMQTRMSERRDTHEDMLSEMGDAVLEISLGAFTKAEIQIIAGDEAVWPDMAQSADEIYRYVSVRCRAGSSGKPNAQKEREQWMQLLPIIQETMKGVTELRLNGQTDMANGAVQLMRETLARFEENLDLDSIIPPMEPGSPQEQMMQMQQELTKVKADLQACQEQLQQCQQDLAKAQQQEQAAVIEAQTKDSMALAESQRKDEIAKAEEARRQQEFDAEQRRRDAEHSQKLNEQAADANHQREMEKMQAGAAERTANTKMANDHAVSMHKESLAAESGKAERDATDKMQKDKAAGDQKFQQLMDSLTKAIASMDKATTELAKSNKELADVNSSDRVPQYDKNGNVERVKIDRKNKRETVQ